MASSRLSKQYRRIPEGVYWGMNADQTWSIKYKLVGPVYGGDASSHIPLPYEFNYIYFDYISVTNQTRNFALYYQVSPSESYQAYINGFWEPGQQSFGTACRYIYFPEQTANDTNYNDAEVYGWFDENTTLLAENVELRTVTYTLSNLIASGPTEILDYNIAPEDVFYFTIRAESGYELRESLTFTNTTISDSNGVWLTISNACIRSVDYTPGGEYRIGFYNITGDITITASSQQDHSLKNITYSSLPNINTSSSTLPTLVDISGNATIRLVANSGYAIAGVSVVGANDFDPQTSWDSLTGTLIIYNVVQDVDVVCRTVEKLYNLQVYGANYKSIEYPYEISAVETTSVIIRAKPGFTVPIYGVEDDIDIRPAGSADIDYYYDIENNQATLTISRPTSDIVIYLGDSTAKTYYMAFSQANDIRIKKLPNGNFIQLNSSYQTTIDGGTSQTYKVELTYLKYTIKNVVISGNCEYTFQREILNGKTVGGELYVAFPTDDLNITFNLLPYEYDLNFNLDKVKIIGWNFIGQQENVGSDVPTQIYTTDELEVKIGLADGVSTDYYCVDFLNIRPETTFCTITFLGKDTVHPIPTWVKYKISNVIGNATVNLKAYRHGYDIEYELDLLTIQNPPQIISTLYQTTITLQLATGGITGQYELPKTIKLSNATYEYNSTTGAITEILATGGKVGLVASAIEHTDYILQYAMKEFLEKEINQKYWELVDKTNSISDHYNFFKCSSVYDFNFDEFEQFDENNQIILDQYEDRERYIPTVVGAIDGDREPIPNAFISEVLIPISMYVTLDTIELAIQTLTKLSNESIGQIFGINYYDNNYRQYNFAFVPNLPDFSEFFIQQGQTGKVVNIMLTGILSCNVNYGNSIQYELSFDDGETYHSFIKIDPATSRTNDLYQDQIIGENYTKGMVKTSTWSKSFTMYLFKDSILAKLLVLLTDMDFETIKSLDPYDFAQYDELKFRLKTTYNTWDFPFIHIRDVIIDELSYSDDIGEFITVSISLKDRF